MQKIKLLVTVLAVLLSAAVGHAAVGYTLDVTTEYLTSPPGGATFLGCCLANPDTAFVVITNSGSTTFTGTIGATAISGGGVDFSQAFPGQTLAPGDSVSFSVNDESSNQGGYGGPTGTLQTGISIFLNGLINGSEAVNLSVNDADIHSGVPQVDPLGNTTDSYVIQGGDPFGFDTGDDFELSQAFGHFQFFEASAAVPEPGSIALLGTVAALLFGAGRKRLRKA